MTSPNAEPKNFLPNNLKPKLILRPTNPPSKTSKAALVSAFRHLLPNLSFEHSKYYRIDTPPLTNVGTQILPLVVYVKSRIWLSLFQNPTLIIRVLTLRESIGGFLSMTAKMAAAAALAVEKAST